MRATTLLLIVTLFGIGWPVAAQETSFWVRNTDTAWLGWWPGGGPVVAGLPTLAGSPRWVAPGERVRISVETGRALTVVFVPWDERPGYLTPLKGGVIAPGIFPAQGTLLVDRASLARSTGGAALVAPLQAWNLVPAALVLDGRPDEWPPGPPTWSWSPAFTAGRPWGALPQPRELRVADRDGALWLWFAWEGRPSAAVSLSLGRPGGALEWSLGDPTVWAWTGDQARPVGRSVATDRGLEAWVPWDRLSEAERRAWASGATWSLLVAEGAETKVLVLGPGGLEDAP